MELELINKAIKGDSSAFSNLVQTYQGMITGMLLNLTRDSEIAKDLTQSTFLTAWQKLETFNMGSFKSWLGTIAYRHFLMWRRKQNNAHLIALETVSEHEVTSCRENRAEVENDLFHALGHLSETQREVLIFQNLLGFSIKEISDLLQIPQGTIKSHASRGLTSLKNKFGATHAQS